MHPIDDAAPTRIRIGDLVISVVLLGVFAGAFVAAREWPFQAALFPMLVSAAGAGLAVLKLLGFVVRLRWRSARPEPAVPVARPEPVNDEPVDDQPVDDQPVDDQSLEYVFGTTGARAWTGAVAWVAAFFLGLWLVGVYITVPVFALAYLRTAGKASWPAAGLYAAVAGGVLWLAFTQLLAVPMPTGVF